ncbi:class I SAM-dependent methyltransferase [Nanoarchaeota archaeon]
MGDWESIFKKEGKFFLKPQEDMSRIVKLLKKHKVKKVLDLGCGSGRHVVYLAQHGFDVYGTDVSETGLKITRKWLKEKGLKAVLKKASCYKKFPFKDNFFDAVISTQVIHHNFHKKIKFCISEIERVLKPRGVVFVTVTKSGYKKWACKFREAKPRTFIPLDGPEKGLPHFIYTQKIMKKDFKGFKSIKMWVDSRGHNCLLGSKN